MTLLRAITGFIGYVGAITVAIRSFQLSGDTLPEEVRILLATSGFTFALLGGWLLYSASIAVNDFIDRK